MKSKYTFARAERYTRPMYRLTLFFSCTLTASLLRGGAPESSPVQAAQSLFDVMTKHDAEAGKKLFIPETTMSSVHDDGKATVVPAEQWLTRIGSSKDSLLERMWNPQVLQHGAIAVVWGSYDFHLNGKFHHCGVDSFNLIKTEAGWKIASVSYTSETIGCSPSPLGPPTSQ